MTVKKYKLTEAHKAELPAWRDKWIANAMSTKPMDDFDRQQMRIAIKGLYESAGLNPPPDNRIIFVPSPFVARFAGGFAAAILWMRKNGRLSATYAATSDATSDAAWDATDAATRAATDAATSDATFAATSDATYAATWDATYAATSDATYAATQDATYAATLDATSDATRDATFAATSDATYAATWDATYAATYAATWDATYAATSDATYAATQDATYAATLDATYAATNDATRDATYAATYAATRDATYAATRDATDAATRDATFAATRDATDAATSDATFAATSDATYAATDAATETLNNKWYSSIQGFIDAGKKLGVGEFGFKCAQNSWRMYQGGNFWSGYTALITFFRYVAKLDIDYSKWDFMEKSNIHGSWRIMHPDFCMISDRPRILKVDEQNRPHCADGPFCQWSDGMSLYAWHGVRIPEYWITQKHRLNATDALKWDNLEQRRVACEIIGWDNILETLNAKTIDKNDDAQIGELVEVDIPDIGKEKFLRVTCGTGRKFALPVPPEMRTALQANAWTYGLDEKDYMPEVRT